MKGKVPVLPSLSIPKDIKTPSHNEGGNPKTHPIISPRMLNQNNLSNSSQLQAKLLFKSPTKSKDINLLSAEFPHKKFVLLIITTLIITIIKQYTKSPFLSSSLSPFLYHFLFGDIISKLLNYLRLSAESMVIIYFI